MYPVVVSDLDGTLLNDNHELTQHTRHVFRQLRNRGVRFVIASGRHHQDVKAIRALLGIDMYLITANGARVYNPADELMIQHNIDPSLVQPLVTMASAYKGRVRTNIYQGESWFVEEDDPEILSFHKDSGFGYIKQPLKGVSPHNTQKIFFIAQTHEAVQPLAAAIEARYGDRLTLTYSLPYCFEVMAPGVCKGEALAEVLQLKGHTFEETMVFGDGMNDAGMLKAAGKGLVMGNADKRLLACLPELDVIGSANDNGVSDYLQKTYGL